MADKMEFRGRLDGILKAAEEQGKKITLEEVEKFFEEDALTEEQIHLVCDYLMSQKVAVLGYEQKSGTIKEQTEEPEKLSGEEKVYLTEYMRDIDNMKAGSEEEARLAYYLPKVVEEAVKLHHVEVFIGDMIQEGNVSLMMALADGGTVKNEEEVLKEVRAGMKALIESQVETKRRDKKMVERVSQLDELLEQMKDELGRKAAIDEVAERLGISEEQIEDILKLAGEQAEE